MTIAWLLSSEFESYFVLQFQTFCTAMYPTRILFRWEFLKARWLYFDKPRILLCISFFNLLVIWSIWGQADCTSQGISLPLPLLFPSGGIQWFSTKGCTESLEECFKRTVTHYEVYTSHCCSQTLCNFWARGQIHPNCLTDQPISKPDLVMTRQQLPSISSLKKPQTFTGHRNYGLKPILAFKMFHFSHTTSNSSQKHPFPHHLSPLLSFCLIPFLVTLGLQRSKKCDSLSLIMYIISSLLTFLNISILRNIVTNQLYHKTSNDLNVFIRFPKQTALLFWGNVWYGRNWFNKYHRKNKP